MSNLDGLGYRGKTIVATGAIGPAVMGGAVAPARAR